VSSHSSHISQDESINHDHSISMAATSHAANRALTRLEIAAEDSRLVRIATEHRCLEANLFQRTPPLSMNRASTVVDRIHPARVQSVDLQNMILAVTQKLGITGATERNGRWASGTLRLAQSEMNRTQLNDTNPTHCDALKIRAAIDACGSVERIHSLVRELELARIRATQLNQRSA
jgi:hypothetical protein